MPDLWIRKRKARKEWRMKRDKTFGIYVPSYKRYDCIKTDKVLNAPMWSENRKNSYTGMQE